MNKRPFWFALILGCVLVAPCYGNAATVPAGTTLIVRTSDTISSSDSPGKKFSGKLDTNLVVDGKTVAPAGSKVYGRVNSSQSAGRAFGKSQLSISLTEISVNGKLVPITTSSSLHSGVSSTRKTVGGAGAGALIGAAFDGGRGARRGAAIGGAASVLTPGQAIVVASGTLLDFKLASPVSL